MSKTKKIWLIIAVSMMLTGIIVFGGVMSILNWDFKKLETGKYVTNEYEITESFNNLLITDIATNVEIIPTNDDKCKVVCFENEKLIHTAQVIDGTLTIKMSTTKKWYDHLSINFSTPKISVYIPRGTYNSLSINTNTGDVSVPSGFIFESVDISSNTGNVGIDGITSGSLKISVNTGDVKASYITCSGNVSLKVGTGDTHLSEMHCKDLTSNGSTGNVLLTDVVADGNLKIQLGTGDVTFKRSDANEIFVKTNTGDVVGDLLSEKIFISNTKTGINEVPKTTVGGRCEIKTNTGDINITISK